ncbi:uncharacterized protein Tco025E_08328 [Trypanosoma conorhini]|uniref:Uncharacterized protein n=1 Tax=Trypanosoma conorhini TaxID=83891 RepID=A0A3R7KWJ0_9TRYP|nr:uncharacterized protein Tco025E_08328 [Trypanosoma conorhini]RNF02792.1 hypothetical protein Tco025E_08328 [Trypanosoma conorhini]
MRRRIVERVYVTYVLNSAKPTTAVALKMVSECERAHPSAFVRAAVRGCPLPLALGTAVGAALGFATGAAGRCATAAVSPSGGAVVAASAFAGVTVSAFAGGVGGFGAGGVGGFDAGGVEGSGALEAGVPARPVRMLSLTEGITRCGVCLCFSAAKKTQSIGVTTVAVATVGTIRPPGNIFRCHSSMQQAAM